MSAIYDHAADLWDRMHREYRLVSEAQYHAAEVATNANMVNARGRAAGWASWDVFHGPPSVVTAYGTEELWDHLNDHPRTTLRAFEAQWVQTYLGGN